MSEPASGQVFDLGFRRYEGQREGRRRAVLAVYKDGLRTAMGLGRGGKAKILPWLFIAASIIPALVFALIAGAVDRLAADFSEALDLPSHADYYSIAASSSSSSPPPSGRSSSAPTGATGRSASISSVRSGRPTTRSLAGPRWQR